jgi:hypothetical protein
MLLYNIQDTVSTLHISVKWEMSSFNTSSPGPCSAWQAILLGLCTLLYNVKDTISTLHISAKWEVKDLKSGVQSESSASKVQSSDDPILHLFKKLTDLYLRFRLKMDPLLEMFWWMVTIRSQKGPVVLKVKDVLQREFQWIAPI